MKVDSIINGIVIDHITAGKGMKIYNLLELDALGCSVALIKNAPSRKMGKKDIIKIDSDFDVNFEILGYVDPDVTVNIIKNGSTVEKKTIELPEKLTNVLKCKNPQPPSRNCPTFLSLQTNKTAYTAVFTAKPRQNNFIPYSKTPQI